jgi:hypothetical protein
LCIPNTGQPKHKAHISYYTGFRIHPKVFSQFALLKFRTKRRVAQQLEDPSKKDPRYVPPSDFWLIAGLKVLLLPCTYRMWVGHATIVRLNERKILGFGNNFCKIWLYTTWKLLWAEIARAKFILRLVFYILALMISWNIYLYRKDQDWFGNLNLEADYLKGEDNNPKFKHELFETTRDMMEKFTMERRLLAVVLIIGFHRFNFYVSTAHPILQKIFKLNIISYVIMRKVLIMFLMLIVYTVFQAALVHLTFGE